MKKIFVFVLLVVGMTTFAQEEKMRDDKPGKNEFTSEQKNQLMFKKIVLELGLSEVQQKEMAVIIAEQRSNMDAARKKHKENEANGKNTTDEEFAMKNKMLDEKIATNARVKKILLPEQFAKWNEMNKNRGKDMGRKPKDEHDKKD